MIELNDRDYKRLLDGRNAMGAALQRMVNASTSESRQASNADQATELAEAIKQAKDVLGQYGEHQGFVLM